MAIRRKKKDGAVSNKNRLATSLQLSPDSYSGCPMLEICGDSEVFISGCYSLLEYTDDMISFSSALGMIRINGKSLSLSGFSEKRMTVNGKILGVKIGEDEKSLKND